MPNSNGLNGSGGSDTGGSDGAKSFTELTINQFLIKWTETLIDILEERLASDPPTVAETFFGGDRMVYLGFTVCLISFLTYLVDITS